MQYTFLSHFRFRMPSQASISMGWIMALDMRMLISLMGESNNGFFSWCTIEMLRREYHVGWAATPRISLSLSPSWLPSVRHFALSHMSRHDVLSYYRPTSNKTEWPWPETLCPPLIWLSWAFCQGSGQATDTMMLLCWLWLDVCLKTCLL